ncbi:Transglutaminase-like superfamily protein [Ruminococcus flavefaciens]|uniref:Transglutaminase-like superfamily protein n=1 Tax=Ruminococcus flavefaciens TaxID=1265 RepID=A0A1H6HTG0_RUMFL|nr:transglutaminase-like domain-containing protein [Ruminococcus flavefaciens]SEH37435.1 Transglutaminase-like superfamily protein [Ruminococcus flavefaciens]
MKRKNSQNINGISISDSIVMSVKRKNANYRKPFSALIAVIGFTSVLMSFFGMFPFRFNGKTVAMAAIGFSIFYLTLSLLGKKALWVYGGSIAAFVIYAYKKSSLISMGFKFVYNIIYKTSYHSEINYYKTIIKSSEIKSVTTLFVFYVWLLAIVLYFFTICRPNPVLPLMVTFPLLELGMYNGIEVSVFWGMLCIAYWLSLLAMSTIDVGEYSGGQSGFVRKNNLFFPKRHMKLKVTEKCGIFIIASVMLVTAVSYSFLKITHYKRSDAINEKRRDITEAMNDFTFENLAESLSSLTSAFGLDFEYENHKLGTNDHVRYKNVTDLTVTIEQPVKGAIYLKNYVGSIYKDNEWFKLPKSAYKNKIFDDFKKYDIYPQDFPAIFTKLIYSGNDNTIWIKNSKKKMKYVYAPYGTENFGGLSYQNDLTVSPQNGKKGESSYKFFHIDIESISESIASLKQRNHNLREVFSASDIHDKLCREDVLEYCTENDLLTYDDFFSIDYDIPYNREYVLENGATIMAQLLQNSYKDFVYDEYLDVPNTKAMKEVKEAYAEVLEGDTSSIEGKLEVLKAIKDKMQGECVYSLYPRKTPSNRDFVNYFLLENHKGYCINFATAGVILARMAGIPARYATGYIIVEDDVTAGKKNSDNSVTVEVKDNRSHAWTEIYLDGIGWIPYEFTSGYSAKEINTEPTKPAESTSENSVTSTTQQNTQASTTLSSAARTSGKRTTLTTSQATQTVTSKVGGVGIGKGNGKAMPKAVKYILHFLLVLLLTALIIALRRYLIIQKREKNFNSGKTPSRVKNIYSYSEKLLASLKLTSENGNYKSFAEEVEKKLAGDYFEAGSFEKLTDIALRACYGQGVPDEDELKMCRKTVEDISAKIYNNANFIQRLRLKFINVLK